MVTKVIATPVESAPLSFSKTINQLEEIGYNTDYKLEVGAGDSLYKSSKFIDGDFKLQTISKGKYL